jgi:hypothetical protein
MKKINLFLLSTLAFTLVSLTITDQKGGLILRSLSEVRSENCLCPPDHAPIGVICSDNRAKFSLEPEGGCICGNNYLIYWICKKK